MLAERASMAAETMRFDTLDPIEISVVIGGVSYVLREASAKAGAAYRNARFAGINFSEDGAAGSPRLGDRDPLLVSLCLFHEDGKPVGLEAVLAWPDRIVLPLAEKIRQISELDGDAEEAVPKSAKNAPDTSPAGSV